ncbi:MAG TPA: LacI family DNA-binding transcriptional regulator [Azospirillum sp.]|nr:LacI family DNA-binding transcriptional regulator [Azospirillum sp.]
MTTRKPRSSRSGRATMADVARAVGVSTMTVSRALRAPEMVSDAVRERIAAASRRLGFVPSRVASALASERSMNIVVLIPSLSNAVFIDLLAGIQQTLGALDYQMLIGVTGYAPEDEEQLLRTYLSHDPDGVLLTGLDHSPGTWELLRTLPVPVVHTMDLTDRDDCLSVGFSQFDAGHAVGRHLVERGYRRIGLVAAQLDPRTLRRCEGWRHALREAGLHEPGRELMVPDASSIGLGATLLERMLADHPDCDALFLCNDDLAQGAIFQCTRLGIAVPGRLAIAGFNDLAASAWTTPPLTTVATPRYEIGREAARLLVSRIDGRTAESRSIDLGFRLLVREST